MLLSFFIQLEDHKSQVPVHQSLSKISNRATLVPSLQRKTTRKYRVCIEIKIVSWLDFLTKEKKISALVIYWCEDCHFKIESIGWICLSPLVFFITANFIKTTAIVLMCNCSLETKGPYTNLIVKKQKKCNEKKKQRTKQDKKNKVD